MKISYIWLKELVDHNLSPEELSDGLTSLGLETGILNNRRGAYEGIVVGKVESVEPHPDADKLSLTSVNTGKGTVPIVCGAPNVAAGQTVAVAVVGATLPNGLKIEKRKIRGVASEGMICSESELEISEESAGILVLDGAFEAGRPISEYLELEDVILEIDLTPNRGDCLGLIGVAREVAALTGGRLKSNHGNGNEKSGGIDGFDVKIENPKGCPRYTAREISGVKIAASPLKIRRRLHALGIRPINNVVDITNYVMMETGHPLHAFDRRDIGGKNLIIRNAVSGEKFTTLDGKEQKLKNDMLVIADAGKAVALAGVMGGLNSEVKNDTTEVILETAYFNPASIRRTSKNLGISSESSYRFERGVDPMGVAHAGRRAAELMAEHAGGKIGGYVDLYPEKILFPSIPLRTGRVNKILGLELSSDEIGDILSRYDLTFTWEEGGFSVSCPSHRHDMKEEIDLIEEIARLVGYANIPPTSVRLAQHDSPGENSYAKRRKLNRLWTAAGLTETVNYSFINPRWREWIGINGSTPASIKNRINADWAELRTSLLPGLFHTVAHNLRQGEGTISIFETGTVFSKIDGEVKEEFLSAGIITGGEEEVFGMTMPRDFYRLKGIVEKVIAAFTGSRPELVRPVRPLPFLYTHRQVEIKIGVEVIGFMGQVHTLAKEPFEIDCDILCFEISIARLLQSIKESGGIRALPKFPGIRRDLALIVDEKVETGELINTIMEADRKRIRSCQLFDLYRGKQVPEGKKSIAFKLFFIDEEKTLTDETGDEIIKKILNRVKEKQNAELRG